LIKQIEAKHIFSYAGINLSIYDARKGEGLNKHTHKFSHGTFVTSGLCVIRKENKEVIIDKESTPINLVSEEWHEIEALEDGTVFINVFAEGKY
jgi:quercetin dioxygenase-like cupin family protein